MLSVNPTIDRITIPSPVQCNPMAQYWVNRGMVWSMVLGLVVVLFVYNQPYLFRLNSPPSSPYHQSLITSKIPSIFKTMSYTNPSAKKTAAVIFSHGLGDSSRGWHFLIEEFSSQMPWIKWSVYRCHLTS